MASSSPPRRSPLTLQRLRALSFVCALALPAAAALTCSVFTTRCAVVESITGDDKAWPTWPIRDDDPRFHLANMSPPPPSPVWTGDHPPVVADRCPAEDTGSFVFPDRSYVGYLSTSGMHVRVHDTPGDLRFGVTSLEANEGESLRAVFRLTSVPPHRVFMSLFVKCAFVTFAASAALAWLALAGELFVRRRRARVGDPALFRDAMLDAHGVLTVTDVPGAIPTNLRPKSAVPALAHVRLPSAEATDYRTAPQATLVEAIPRTRDAEHARLDKRSRRLLAVPIALAILMLAGGTYLLAHTVFDTTWTTANAS